MFEPFYRVLGNGATGAGLGVSDDPPPPQAPSTSPARSTIAAGTTIGRGQGEVGRGEEVMTVEQARGGGDASDKPGSRAPPEMGDES